MDGAQGMQVYFGEQVRRYRKQAGLTLKQLAHRVEKTEASLSRIENGKQNITLEDIALLAEQCSKLPAHVWREPGGAGRHPGASHDADGEAVYPLYAGAYPRRVDPDGAAISGVVGAFWCEESRGVEGRPGVVRHPRHGLDMLDSSLTAQVLMFLLPQYGRYISRVIAVLHVR